VGNAVGDLYQKGKMLRIAGLLFFIAFLSGCYEPQYLYPVGARSLLPVATSYIKEEPGLFGTLAGGGYTTKSVNGTQPMGVTIDGSMGYSKRQLVVEGYLSGSLGKVNVVHYNSGQMVYDSLEIGYRSIMVGARGMATFPFRNKFAFGVGPDLFYHYEDGDYETFRRVNGIDDTTTLSFKEFRRIGNNEGFGSGIHIDEKYRFNEKVAIGMQQTIVYTNLNRYAKTIFDFMDFLQIAENIYVDIFDRNRFYVQFGIGQSEFAGIGYRFLMFGNSGKRE
jgi:hypothetical protein